MKILKEAFVTNILALFMNGKHVLIDKFIAQDSSRAGSLLTEDNGHNK